MVKDIVYQITKTESFVYCIDCENEFQNIVLTIGETHCPILINEKFEECNGILAKGYRVWELINETKNNKIKK